MKSLVEEWETKQIEKLGRLKDLNWLKFAGKEFKITYTFWRKWRHGHLENMEDVRYAAEKNS